MSFLPIVNRELLIAAKRKGTYQLRAVAALLSLLFTGYLLFFTEFGNFSSDRFGRNILTLLSTFSFVYCLLAGVFFTSDCIATERREGTIGLLFLTKLKSYDVTTGKLVAHSLTSVYGLIATFPVLALSMMFGGVTNDMFVRTALALIACLSLSLSVGLLMSAFFDNPKHSMTASVMIIGFLAFAPPLLERVIFGLFNSVALHPSLFLISPFTLLKTAWSTPTILPFWRSLATIFGMAVFSFALATVLTSRWRQLTNDRSSAQPSVALQERTRPQAKRRKKLHRRIREQHPFQWFTAVSGRDNQLLWLLLISASFPFLWMFFDGETMWLAIGFYSLFPFHILLKTLVTADACRRVHLDKRSGLLELLCITPQPSHLLPAAYYANLRSQYLRPAQFLSALNAAALVGFYVHSLGQPGMAGDTLLLLTLILGGGVLLLFVDLHALIWLGLKEGLTQEKSNRATFKTLGRMMAFSWVALLFIIGYIMGGVHQSSAAVLTFLWQLASVSWALHLARKSRHELQSHFRELAAASGRPPLPTEPTGTQAANSIAPMEVST